MKAILISVRPQWVAKILNGEKTIEIRKKFPKDYVGWVYIYCTKNGDYLMKKASGNGYITCMRSIQPKQTKYSKSVLNGKVIARFWCDKVENLYEYQIDGYGSDYEIASDTLKQEELLKECCLTYEQLNDYLGDINNGYAIHITELEIFDKPKELALHTHDISAIFYTKKWDRKSKCWRIGALTHAPRNGYCYIEI